MLWAYSTFVIVLQDLKSFSHTMAIRRFPLTQAGSRLCRSRNDEWQRNVILLWMTATWLLLRCGKVTAFASFPARIVHHPWLSGVSPSCLLPTATPVTRSFPVLRAEPERIGAVFGSSDAVCSIAVPRTWSEALALFFLDARIHGPRIIACCIVVLLVCRWQLGSTPSWTEAGVSLVTAVIWCLQEHFLHRHLLHSSWNWWGKTIHEQHHHDWPYHHVAVDPAPLMISWLAVVAVLVGALVPNVAVALTAVSTYAVLGLFYEWTHYLVHTRVIPPSSSSNNWWQDYWCQVRNHHQRHHVVDDGYWFAFSLPAVDTLFGTNPSIRQVVQARKNGKYAKE
jgi:Fatty acid hydroxylase superfamily